MITKEEIWAKTDGGKTIIEHFYPQSRDSFDNPNKKFRIRDEKTPSAALKFIGDCWFVTDFGDNEKGKHAIQIVMDELNYTYEAAVEYIASAFNIGTSLSKEVNKPRIEYLDAVDGQSEGDFDFLYRKSGFTEAEVKCMCPVATKEHLEALNFHPAEWIATVRKGKVIKKYSTENYFIFIRECAYKENEVEKKFYKIYEPLNPEKAYRFRYSGPKPKDYINGLRELQELHAKMNGEEESHKKVDEAIICSGERDAVTVKALGYCPIWFNSETYEVTKNDIFALKKYVDVIYNVPDIDETGVRQGKKLALKFLEIHTMWLPQNLRNHKDMRGRPRKDLRDWIDIVGKKAFKDFKLMMNRADPAQFWYWADNGWQISREFLLNFLQLYGFARLYDKERMQNIFVYIDNNIVTKKSIEEIRFFVIEWAREHGLARDIRDKIHGSRALGEETLKALTPLDLDFSSADEKRQLFFFKNMSVEVSADGYTEYIGNKSSELQHYVWDNNIVKHDVSIIDPLFDVTWERDEFGKMNFDIKVNSFASKFFCFLINTSRIYWRKEMEERFKTKEERDEYRSSHRYCINGEGLTDDEIKEQKLNLINKLFAIGYLAYKYKEADRAFAPLCMDYKIGAINQSNGGSGKSIFGNFFKIFMNVETKDGKDADLLKNRHVWGNLTKYTDLVFVDDLVRNMQMDSYYNLITQDMSINPKGKDIVSLPFEDSPKFLLTTNFVPRDSDPSSVRRLMYVNFSDFYHQATASNDYLESRTVAMDFGKQLFGKQYTEREWNADLNLVMLCVKLYLSLRPHVYKIDPPMENIFIRRKLSEIGQDFLDWADETFADYPENPNIDHLVVRAELFNSFMQTSNMAKIKAAQFKKKLELYCDVAEHIEELNPQDVVNNRNSRILMTKNGSSIEYFFIRTKRAAEEIRTRKAKEEFKKLNENNNLFD